jgi:hypothetical protein
MPAFAHTSSRSFRPPGGARGVWGLARWLVLLVLMFDCASAAFHQHGHDGIDLHDAVAAHAGIHDVDTHVDGEEHPRLSHAAMAIKVEPSQSAQPQAGPDGHPAPMLAAAELLAALGAPPPPDWRPDRSQPDFRSHRSLPPAGRAPPLHA